MASYNRVVLVGNLTRDPELRYISSGTAVTEIGLAYHFQVVSLWKHEIKLGKWNYVTIEKHI